jgi:hypothetical protein
MSKTNETTKLGPATLAETELDAVTGGTPAQSVINTRAVARPEPLYPPSRNRTQLMEHAL